MSRSKSTEKEPHRELFVDAGDMLLGEDVRSLQAAYNRRRKTRPWLPPIAEDGVFGPATMDAFLQAGRALGALESTLDHRDSKGRPVVTIGVQQMIRYPGRRTPRQLVRAGERRAKLALTAVRPGGEPAHDTRLSPNRSSRNGTAPRVIVLHDTEGGYAGSVAWLCNPAAQASAHVVVSKTGHSTRLVPDAEKAWHVANDNPFTLGIEQEGFASQTVWPEEQLRATAAWVAYWADKYGIPLTHSTSHGVCQHKDLGLAGGGHHDCGEHYPFDHVLALAGGL